MIHGLVLTHGGIGEQMVEVVRMILGRVEGLRAASNLHCSARQATDLVEAWLAELGAEMPGIVFIDESGGSCASAALLAGTEAAGVPILGGVNLAMLLAFATWREELTLAELVQRIVDQGRRAVSIVGSER